MEQKLIDGKEMASDGSYIPAEVSRNNWTDLEVKVEQSMLSYLGDLDQELAAQSGFKKPPTRTITKKITTSATEILSVVISTTEISAVGISYGSNRRLQTRNYYRNRCISGK